MDEIKRSSDIKTVQHIDVPNIHEIPFVPSKVEKLALLFSFPIAFIYTFLLMPNYGDENWYVYIAAFTVLFIVWAKFVHRDQKAVKESFIWLGCIAVIVASMLFNRNQVWGDTLSVFFIHCFAVYWLMAGSGRLIEQKSGSFAPLDVLNGFVIFPFKHFFLRIRVLWNVLTSKLKKNVRRESRTGAFIAVFAGIVLFLIAGGLLSSADDNFDRIVGEFLKYLQFDLFSEFPMRLIISIPVGAYLYGLILGSKREDPVKLSEKKDFVLNKLDKIKKVPTKVWTIILGAFSLLYLLFFFIQGSYLFGAFSRTLPEGFTVAQYARQGFFELCQIMGLNFFLIWIVTRSSNEEFRNNRPVMIMSTVLLAESILFSITAFSKLMLYISCFGFTPLRLQSTWLICVLFCGSALAIYSLWTRKRSFNIWMFISGISLALLHLY